MAFQPSPQRSWDRVGVALAWLAILACVAFTVWRVFAMTDERAATRRRLDDDLLADKSHPAHVLNPQLAMQSKANVGLARMTPGENTAVEPQLRELARSPAERVWIVPALVEIAGVETGRQQLDAVDAELTTAAATGAAAETGPASATTTSAAATAPASRPASALGRDIAALRQIYADGPTSLDAGARARLEARLGWAGRLALTHGLPDDHPDRAAVLSSANRLMLALFAFGFLMVLSLVAGVALLVLAILALARGSIRLRYAEGLSGPTTTADRLPAAPMSAGGAISFSPAPMPAAPDALGLPPLPAPWDAYRGVLASASAGPGSAGAGVGAGNASFPNTVGFPVRDRLRPLGERNGATGPFLEAFALYLTCYLGFGFIAYGLFDIDRMWAQWIAFIAIPIAMVWPLVRGVGTDAWRHGFGLTVGAGPLREAGSGVVVYLAGLPLVALCTILSLALIRLSGATPHHPVADELGAGADHWAILRIYLLAAVAAPITEELLFRGALFHHLRTRWSWLLSAVLSALIFAAIHPQGWAMIPSLASLAIVFAAMREWRGSNLPSIVAHALHNSAVVTIGVLGGT